MKSKRIRYRILNRYKYFPIIDLSYVNIGSKLKKTIIFLS